MAFVNFFFEWLVFFHFGVVATCCQLPLSVLFGISTRTFFYLFSSHRSSKHVASLIPSLRHKLAIFWKQQIYIYIYSSDGPKKKTCVSQVPNLWWKEKKQNLINVWLGTSDPSQSYVEGSLMYRGSWLGKLGSILIVYL